MPGYYWVRDQLDRGCPRLVYVIYNAELHQWEAESFGDLMPMRLEQSFRGAFWMGPLVEPA
ncbi:hypothetical protein CY652_17940 [Burkholderia sp. WAC0059]|nr:hypothetical protein CY652_17940 [Burkholderia sp. WAC0059]